MAKVVRDLQNGKSVQLSYRHKIIGTLQPAGSASPRRGSPQTVHHFLSQDSFGPIPKKLQGATTSFKQEIAELRHKELP